METIDEITHSAIERYYNYLDNVGYISNEDTFRVLLLSYINHLVQDFFMYITEQDINTIYRVLNCLSKSCLIDPPDFSQVASILKDSNYGSQRELRVSENDIQRISEDDILRSANLKL